MLCVVHICVCVSVALLPGDATAHPLRRIGEPFAPTCIAAPPHVEKEQSNC